MAGASFAPWLKLYGERWRVIAGVNLLYDANDLDYETHLFLVRTLQKVLDQEKFKP